MHHNQEVAYFAGKQEWESCKLVWYDSEQQPDTSAGIYNWIETIVNMQIIGVSAPTNYKRTAELDMLDGGGGITETWTMYGTWPEACNWMELNYTTSDLLTLEATMRYDRAVRSCLSALSPYASTPSC